MPRNSQRRTGRDATEELEIAMRRKTVANNLLSGMSYRDIAEAMQVARSTVSRDVKALKKEWREDSQVALGQFMAVQLRRYQTMLNGVWGDALDGKLAAMDRVLSIMDRMNQLYGVPDDVNFANVDDHEAAAAEEIETAAQFKARQAELDAELVETLEAFMDEDGNIEGFNPLRFFKGEDSE